MSSIKRSALAFVADVLTSAGICLIEAANAMSAQTGLKAQPAEVEKEEPDDAIGGSVYVVENEVAREMREYAPPPKSPKLVEDNKPLRGSLRARQSR